MKRLFRSLLCFGVWLGVLVLASVHLSGYAQTVPSLTRSAAGADQGELEKLFGGRTAAVPTAETVFEGAVNPDEYVLGPGDRLNIVFWQPTFREYPVVVSGDGSVVIPLVGVQPVARLTLTEARARLEAAVSAALRVGRITVSLIEPRRFRVHVTGLVEQPGTYVLPATARVADAVDLAGGLKRERAFARGDTASKMIASERRIELSSPDGTRAGHADLLLFRRGGRLKANPYLRDGLTIHVPYPAGAFEQVGVFGAVPQSGLFEYVEGDQVADVIALGGGLAANADSSAAAVIAASGRRTELDLRAAGESGLEYRLHAGDRLYVAGFPDTSRAGSVVLQGEVARPGGYPIVSGETTLREVLQAGGGLLPTAAANSARLVRKVPKDLVEPERFRVLQANLLNMPKPAYETDPELAAEFARWDYGTVVLDLTDAQREGSERGNLRLQDGDVLEVPRSPLGVRVLGAVNNAGEVNWQPDGRLSHYLTMAGGVNKLGWRSRTVIIKARSGSHLQYQSSLPIDPGDVIFVPAKKQVTGWEMVKDLVAVSAQVATIALIIQNVGKGK
ncbi:MAG: SLBB domain-containing protein [bacterium]|nr:SLBB domain-containing protein [bacterium]